MFEREEEGEVEMERMRGVGWGILRVGGYLLERRVLVI